MFDKFSSSLHDVTSGISFANICDKVHDNEKLVEMHDVKYYSIEMSRGSHLWPNIPYPNLGPRAFAVRR